MADAPGGESLPSKLLATLGGASGVPDLELDGAPEPLTGGYYAELFRFRLLNAPDGMDGDLVARIVPDPDVGAWEATVHRAVSDQGFPTPAVRLVVPPPNPLGRFVIVMDAVDGSPPLAGLSAGAVLTGLPALLRGLPDQLAHLAADLHRLEVEPLASRLASLDDPGRATTSGYVGRLIEIADEAGRRDLAGTGRRLRESQPPSVNRVITHGDLHPFNLLVTSTGTVLIDWTNAGIAHPAFTVSFTQLVLANPPVELPRPGSAALSVIGRRISRRFITRYRSLTDGTVAAVDDEQLEWHRQVHALRLLVELAELEAGSGRPEPGHPWILLEPVARRTLGLQG